MLLDITQDHHSVLEQPNEERIDFNSDVLEDDLA